MAENYFPRAEDFDEMGNHLEVIANILANKVEVSSWASIQKAVRAGLAPTALPVGTQLTADHSLYGKIKLDVVAHNHYESADRKGANTMTLMCHDVIETTTFDLPEAFYYAEAELPAGTYHFYLSMDSSSTGQFTLDQPLPKGGALRFYGNPSYSIDSSEIWAYDNRTILANPHKYAITVGKEGVSLGTLGVELNNRSRVFYGSNNYAESWIRQFLNSTAEAGKVWSPQTKFDIRFTDIELLAGFANGLDSELLKVIGRVVVPCVANGEYESPDSIATPGEKYTVSDKFYIPSIIEMTGMIDFSGDDGSKQLPYFEGCSDVDLIKYATGNAKTYYLRSPYYYSPHECCGISNQGYTTRSTSSMAYGVVPMFNIV